MPAKCSVGETFFQTDAEPGQNLYLCAETDKWTQIRSGAGGVFVDEAGVIRLATGSKSVSLGGGSAEAKLSVIGTADQVQGIVRGNAAQSRDLYQFQQSDGSVVARVDPQGFVTEGIGTNTGHVLRIGNAGDLEGSSVTVHGGDGPSNSEPGHISAFSSDPSAPFQSYLYPCHAAGFWCASGTLPSMDSNDYLLSASNPGLIQNKVFDITNSVGGYMDWATIDTPADDPGDNVLRIYAKAGRGLCWKDTSGQETCAATGEAGTEAGGGLPDPGAAGMVARLAGGGTSARAITGSAGKITVQNGSGQAGDPNIATGPDIVDMTLPATYTAGAKQTYQPSATTAGQRIVCGPLPLVPETGDMACDSAGGNTLKQYNGAAWVDLAATGGGGGGGESGGGTLIDHQGPLAQQTGTGSTQSPYSTTIAGGIPAGKCIRVSLYYSQDSAPSGGIFNYIYLGASGYTSLENRNEINNKSVTAHICNNAGVQDAQVLASKSFSGTTSLAPNVRAATENASTDIIVKWSYNLPSGALYTPQMWIVEWVK